MHFFHMKCFVNKSGFKPESVLNLVIINIRHILRHGAEAEDQSAGWI